MGNTIFLTYNGRPEMPIIIQKEAIETEIYAGEELARFLYEITGAKFEILKFPGEKIPKKGILIGYGGVTKNLFPEEIEYISDKTSQFGGEQIIIKTKGNYILISGGRPRGTIYSVYHFLSKVCGIRWWTPWATYIPKKKTLKISDLNIKEKPAFEYREVFWYHALDGDWACRNYCNGHHHKLTEKHGGNIKYKGFVHTFYWLCPPSIYFKKKPYWFSLINRKREWKMGQLCCTNRELRDFLVERVKEYLKESPDANIISISQNDWGGNCQCEKCKEIDDKENSHSASILDMVNYIAEKLKKEFSNVAFDTLAYQYSRKPPKTIKPTNNVIIRLCTIECNFAQPLDHKSNQEFVQDISGWSKLTDRIYIWDYTTNFSHYLLPHPNWFSLGPNIRFFHKYGVKGVFEQGAYQSIGAEFAELRAWLLAQLLWNPYQDDKKLIDEFLNGYYGKAGVYIKKYMELLYNSAKDYYLTCYTKPDAPFLTLEILSKGEELWKEAEESVRNNPEIYQRVLISHISLYYTFLKNWDSLKEECEKTGKKWPLQESKRELVEKFLKTLSEKIFEGFGQVTHLNESGLTPEKFIEEILKD